MRALLTPMLPIKTPSASRRGTPPGKVIRPPLLCSRPYTLEFKHEPGACIWFTVLYTLNLTLQVQVIRWILSKSMPVSVARWNIWLAYRLARQGLLPQFCRLFPRNWATYYCASKNNCSLLCRCAVCSGVVSKNNAHKLHIVQHVPV